MLQYHVYADGGNIHEIYEVKDFAKAHDRVEALSHIYGQALIEGASPNGLCIYSSFTVKRGEWV